MKFPSPSEASSVSKLHLRESPMFNPEESKGPMKGKKEGAEKVMIPWFFISAGS
jgi:hypothetical protein